MTVETWDAFIWVLKKSLPVLSPGNRRTIKGQIAWADRVKPQKGVVKQSIIDGVRDALLIVITKSRGTVRVDLTAAWTFLGWINKKRSLGAWRTEPGCKFWGGYWWGNACHTAPWTPKPEDHKTPDACRRAGFYWYNSKCHKNKLSCGSYTSSFDCNYNGCYWYNNRCNGSKYIPPPPPPPPPPPKPCNRITSQSECLARSCYWYGGRCHSSPKPAPTPTKRPFEQLADDAEVFCKTIPIWDIPKLIVCNMFRDILRLLDDFLDFSK